MWFTDKGKRAIGRIPTSATPADPQVNEYTGMTGSSPSVVAPGPDGAIWFGEFGGDSIDRLAIGSSAAVR